MIKFRGIPLKDAVGVSGSAFDGTFVYGYYVKNGNGAMIVGDQTDELDDVGLSRSFVDIDPETVGQFTGLKDMNGKAIYTGDIVHAENEAKYVRNGEVVFRDGAYWYDNGMDSQLLHPTLEMSELTVLEVIGNVHQDKELIDFDKSKSWRK